MTQRIINTIMCVIFLKISNASIAYNVNDDIECFSSNTLSDKEACRNWKLALKKTNTNHIICNDIDSSDRNKKLRMCGPAYFVWYDIPISVNYKTIPPSDTSNEKLIAYVNYDGLSDYGVMLYGIIILSLFILICICVCNIESSDNNLDFVDGCIIGSAFNSWDDPLSSANGFDVHEKYD